jgi:HTH-type transcriptional regulator / antitoxin HigA
MDISPIRNEADYERALRRVEGLWDSVEGSTENDELDILTTLIEAYEREHYPIDLPDPVEAIKFRLEQTGKDSRALVGVIGQRTRVYEVMRGKRPLSLNMIRNLHEKLEIPADVLIQPAGRYRKIAIHRREDKSRRGGLRNCNSEQPKSLKTRENERVQTGELGLANRRLKPLGHLSGVWFQ